MTMSRRAPHRRARSLAAIGAAVLVAGCPPSQRSAPEPPASSAPAPTAQAPAAPASGAAPARVMSAEPPLPPPTGRRPFEGADLSPKPPVQPLSPADEQKRFVLPAGYRMEPVLTDPDISEPVQIAFDGDGRMYVAEMRSYMMDVEATKQFTRISRISRHEDRDGDGVYERHTV